MLGSPAEAPLAAEIVGAAGPAARDLTSPDLRNAILALKCASACVSNDSGLVHVAAAIGTPTIGIFGPTSPWHWAPLNPLAAVIETLTDVPCRPCHKPTCRLVHHRCMLDIPAAQVLPAVQRALAAAIADLAPATLATRGPPCPIRATKPSSPTSAARSRRSSAHRPTRNSSPPLSPSPSASPPSLKSGGKVLLAGNGGSAADAQHIAAEFVGRFIDDRAPLAAIALTTDTSALTAIGNDYGFEQVFERQVRALGRKGDVFIGISTSGRSPNIVAALQGGARAGPHHHRLHQGRADPDARAVRSHARRARRGDRADPADPHHRGARDLPSGRARAVRRESGTKRS